MAASSGPSEGSSSSNKSPAQIDKAAVEKYNRLMAESLKREEKLHKHYTWRGNKLPPLAIEPQAHERQRLSQPMSHEDRALRKQWLADQKLSSSEPRYIPELYPQNPIRRLLAAPWDAAQSLVSSIMGKKLGGHFRYYGPKAAMTAAVVWAAWYNVKYTPQTWTGKQGWHKFESRDVVLPGHPSWPHPITREPQEFFDRGFRDRKVFKDL